MIYQKKEEFELSNNQKYLKEMGLDVEWYSLQIIKTIQKTLTNLGDISSLEKKCCTVKFVISVQLEKTLYLAKEISSQI